ncbi:putative membrane protein [Paraburkholderia rhizosphaerae]|uniref:Putative membrane protein n=2 Tax=Paraburkholderia rhizosphaerae TaxID=480658 RepID=A0A4V3HFC8_9BURK|nr:putative membrane protein [Paraburkholderia rhizosphaerae]
MLFIWNGSVLQSIIPQLMFVALVDIVAVTTHGSIFGEKVPLNATPFTLVGVALTIFLAFRNNASYSRYWEARQLWGEVMTAGRVLASQVSAYVPADAHFERRGFIHKLIAFTYVMKHQLRGTEPFEDIARYVPPQRSAALLQTHFRPVSLLTDLRGALAERHTSGAISSQQLMMLDNQINHLTAAVTGCERIASTPIPYPYGVLLHRTVYAYCLLLPFGLVDSIGVATPIISLFVAYTLIALEAIASEVAEPFGKLPNSLPLDALTRNFERSLLEQCGEAMPAELTVGPGYQLT